MKFYKILSDGLKEKIENGEKDYFVFDEVYAYIKKYLENEPDVSPKPEGECAAPFGDGEKDVIKAAINENPAAQYKLAQILHGKNTVLETFFKYRAGINGLAEAKHEYSAALICGDHGFWHWGDDTTEMLISAGNQGDARAQDYAVQILLDEHNRLYDREKGTELYKKYLSMGNTTLKDKVKIN